MSNKNWTQVMTAVKQWCNQGDVDQRRERRWLFVTELASLAGIPTDSGHDIWATNSLIFEMFDRAKIEQALKLAKDNFKAYMADEYEPETSAT